MGATIDGIEYLGAGDVLGVLGVSRQTLWRWRRERRIPAGHRFRDGRVLFTREEVEQIKLFANRLEPIEATVSIKGH